MTVVVRFSPHARITFPKAVADVFQPNTLTITREHDAVPIELQPDEWIEAMVYDVDGYPVFAFQNSSIHSQQMAADVDPRRI